MKCLVAFLLVAPPSFAAGWYTHGWWTRHREDENVKRLSDRLFNVMFGVLVLGVLGNIVYTNASGRETDEKIAASETRQIEENRRGLACMSRTFQEFLTGNQVLREVSAKRDKALVDLVDLRVIQGIADGPEVRQAARDYIDSSRELTEVRRAYQLPDFEKACGNIVK